MEINTKEFLVQISFPGFHLEAFWAKDGPVVFVEKSPEVSGVLLKRAVLNANAILEIQGYFPLTEWEMLDDSKTHRYTRKLEYVGVDQKKQNQMCVLQANH
jgi:hypothetical protein